jgi:hypothetical protein
MTKKKRKSPQEKKAESYKKDRRLRAEYPHAFRRKWPKKKVRAERSYRRRMHQLLVKLRIRQDEDDIEGFTSDSIRREKPLKWPGTAKPLGAFLEERRMERVQKIARNYFKHPYNSDKHREGFSDFLAEVTKDQGERGRELALAFEYLLFGNTGSVVESELRLGAWRNESRREWLKAFLHDEPEWEDRLIKWGPSA